MRIVPQESATTVGPSTRSERELSAFAMLEDPHQIRAQLSRGAADQLFPHCVITACEVASVRYKTYEHQLKRQKSSALGTYDLEIAPKAGGSSRTARVYVRSFLDRDRCPEFIERSGSAVAVPELNGIAWTIEKDPSLSELGNLLDPDLVHQVLRGGGGKPSVAAVSSRVLRYKPEDRCTVEVGIGEPGQPTARSVAKTFASAERAYALRQTNTRISAAIKRQGARLAAPELIWSSRRTLWTTHLAGVNPTRADLDRGRLQAIAAALADFHALEDVTHNRRRRQDQLDQTIRKSDAIVAAVPTARASLDSIIESLRTRLSSQEPEPVTVHGAFRLRQLLLEGNNVGLVDFDSVALGDQAEDVADFILDLGLGTDADAAEAIGVFLDTYAQAAKYRINLESLRWHLPIQIVKRAHWLRAEARTDSEVRSRLLARLDLATQGDRLCFDLNQVLA